MISPVQSRPFLPTARVQTRFRGSEPSESPLSAILRQQRKEEQEAKATEEKKLREEETQMRERADKLLLSTARTAVFKVDPQPLMKKPNALMRWMSSLSIKTGNAWQWIKRHLIGPIWRPFISKADKSIQDILNEKRPERVTPSAFNRPSRGVAKAKAFLTPKDEIVQKYTKPFYLGEAERSGHGWDEEQVARDALQNFYDGQGQTLKDTRIDIRQEGDKTRIHLGASATYDAENLVNKGMTTKQGDKIATGGFGEGAKVMAYMLLRDYGAETVTFRSREWKVDFTFKPIGKGQSTNYPDLRGLHAQLTLLPESQRVQGNDLSFTVNSKQQKKLVEAFKNGKDLFYHPDNPDFQNPTYENEVGGFKLVANNDSAHFYHAGQRRPIQKDSLEAGLPGMHLWTNTKVLKEVSRDRMPYNNEDAEKVIRMIVEKMSPQQTTEALQVLKEYWFPPSAGLLPFSDESPASKNKRFLVAELCKHLYELTDQGKKSLPEGLNIPQGAYTTPHNPSVLKMWLGKSGEQDAALKRRGHIPLAEPFGLLGVPSGDTLCTKYGFQKTAQLNATRDEKLTLTEQDKRRLAVLKSVLSAINEEVPTNYHKLKEVLSAPGWEIVKNPEPYRSKSETKKLVMKNDLPDDPIEQDYLSKQAKVDARFLRHDNFPFVLAKLVHSPIIKGYGYGSGSDFDSYRTLWALRAGDRSAQWEKEWNRKS